MKILNLRFKNLNSLVGEWQIDLSHPAYLSNGIFAITGPTGSGKSTVLDAICLALYGATPRLGRVSKGSNEIMSRQTGECFAEVTFETPAGRYRCHWSQHRARKRAGGELQQPKHELSNADNGALSQSSLRGVAEEITHVTGMDFERFTRSMLLAQGGFASFLQAEPQERAPILEQITGTEIYSQISKRVHEHLREAREKRNLLSAEIKGIALLEQEQEEEMVRELAATQKQEAGLAAQIGEATQAIAWLNAVQERVAELALLGEEWVRLQEKAASFEPERARLERSLKAASLEGVYAGLLALRREQAEDGAALGREESSLPEREEAADAQAKVLEEAGCATLSAAEALEAAAPLIRRVRLLDQELAHRSQALSEASRACEREAAQIESDRASLAGELEKGAAADRALGEVERFLVEHAQDAWLVGGLAGIEEQFANLLVRQREIARKEGDLKQAVQALKQAVCRHEEASRQSARGKRAQEEHLRKLEEGRRLLDTLLAGRALREYRTEKDSLLRERAYIRRIEELEAQRSCLEDGSPCPLCGSREHPFAQGNVPLPDALEVRIGALDRLITRAEEQEAVLKGEEEAGLRLRRGHEEHQGQEQQAALERASAERTLEALKRDLAELASTWAKLREEVSEKLLPLGIKTLPQEELPALLASLRARLGSWQEAHLRKVGIEKERLELASGIRRLEGVLETQRGHLAEKEALRQRLLEAHRELVCGRKELYGEKDPEQEEARLSRALAGAQAVEGRAREQNAALSEGLTRARTQVEALKKRLEQRAPELGRAEAAFAGALEAAGFADEGAYLNARLGEEEQQALASRARALDEARTELKARLRDRETGLAEERAKALSTQSLEELLPHLAGLEETLKTVREKGAALAHRLRENRAARERIQEKKVLIDDQNRACARWESLHELIGSADGKKYRNFAQGLTFDLMVAHANRQLQKMSDRYLLLHEQTRPLELAVIDAYQAGEIRSTKNLSGGEGFLVSLSLALGLSCMASRNVRVDSLFLDEGFGSLDEEALETALETLSGLQHEGKLIGVISHVSALKERMGVQIAVTPLTGGRSALSGPGCQKIG